MTTNLYELIADQFSKTDLELLATELNVDFDEVARQSRKLTALNLQQLMQRRSATSQLLAEIKRQRPQLERDLNAYLFHVVAEVFYTEEAMIQLLSQFGYQARDFGRKEHLSWGSQPWREEKARYLQSSLEENGRIQALLDALRAKSSAVDLSFYTVATESEDESSPPDVLKPDDDGEKVEQREQADVYDNFDLSLRIASGRFYVDASGPTGEAESLSPLNLQDQELIKLLSYMKRLKIKPEEIEQLGARMYAALFPEKILRLFERSRDRSVDAGKAGLRIRLKFNLEQGLLMKLPWEYCRDDRDFLALHRVTPLVRYLRTDRVPTPVRAPAPVRVLLATANPSDTKQLQVETEAELVRAALDDLIAQQRVDLKVVHHTGRRDLLTEITRGHRPHILHFIGHGSLQEDGEGALLLEDAEGKSDAVDASALMRWLRSSEVRVVFLNACQTAVSGSDEAIMGIAPRLVWQGIPAVIATQYAIPDRTAKAFAGDLYQALADGVPLDRAVTQARLFSSADDERFWGIPVLFMRAPDGVIWQPHA